MEEFDGLTVPINHDAALDQAIAWQQALAHDDADWDGYLAWLDADPDHRRVFDELVLLDRMIDEHARALLADARDHPLVVAEAFAAKDADSLRPQGGQRQWWMIGGLAAAAMAFVLALPWFVTKDAVYETASGETRRIALGDGETVDLAPATRLVARRGDPHALELARGEAFFSVTHDPSRTLRIKADGFAVTDIGTRFGVNFTQDRLTVAVADGQVTVAAIGGESRRVSAGQLLVGHAGRLMPLSPVAAEDVGSWRNGRLVYDRTPLRIVVADLARFSGKRVSVDPVIGDRRFSGVLGISNGSRPFQNLADLMAISYKTEADGVYFTGGAAR